MKTNAFLLGASLAVAGCAAMEQMDREWGGTPSPAVAMFAAQSDVAGEVCPAVPSSLKRREEQTKKVYETTLMLYIYMDDPSFARSRAESASKYRSSWPRMSANEQAAFCNEYYQEVATVTTSKASIDASKFREHFSPPSKAARDRQAAGAVVLGAASIAATAGGIAQADNANFDGAARLNDAGRVLASGIPTNSSSPGYCPAYGHFTQHGAPAGSAPWKRYVSLRSCP